MACAELPADAPLEQALEHRRSRDPLIAFSRSYSNRRGYPMPEVLGGSMARDMTRVDASRGYTSWASFEQPYNA